MNDRLDLLCTDFGIVDGQKQLVDIDAQIAVGVDRIDDRLGDHVVALAQPAEVELPGEVVEQGLRAALLGKGIVIRAVVRAVRGARQVGVEDVGPERVDRQLLGHLVGFGVDLAVDGLLDRDPRRLDIFALDRARLLRLAGVEALRFIAFLQHQIGVQRLLNLLLELQCRELQQTDRLLQLRRHGQVLAEPKLDGLLHESRMRFSRCSLRWPPWQVATVANAARF